MSDTNTDQSKLNHKTLIDGSIDYAHYINRSHEIRSEGALSFLRAFATKLKTRFAEAPRPARPTAKLQRNAQRRYRARHFRGGEWRPVGGQSKPMDLPFNRKA